MNPSNCRCPAKRRIRSCCYRRYRPAAFRVEALPRGVLRLRGAACLLHSRRPPFLFCALIAALTHQPPRKIAATFKKGVLTVTLPKTAEAQKLVKKIEVKGE